jgi:hypothetical protein
VRVEHPAHEPGQLVAEPTDPHTLARIGTVELVRIDGLGSRTVMSPTATPRSTANSATVMTMAGDATGTHR